MDQEYELPFKKGETAEAMSFVDGFRGAWFRCKIHEISFRRGHWRALLEYFDYPDEKWAWTKIYQVPSYSKEIRKLMLRPEYPRSHHKNEVSDFSSNSDVTVDSTLEAGDLVDWWHADCYWSGKVTKLLGNGRAEIELLPPPLGEGATYKVFIKDIRRSLDWSPEFGWAVPASQDGESSCQDSQLLEHVGRGKRNQQATESSVNSSFSGGLSRTLPPKKWDFRNTESVYSKDAANTSGRSSSLEMRSSTPVSYVSSTSQRCTLPPQPPAPADDAQAPAARQLQPERTDSRARLQIMPQGAGFNPPIKSIHDALRVSINRHYHYPYPSWGEIPKCFRKSIFVEYKALCAWLPKYNKITFRKFEKKAAARMADWFYIARRDKTKPDWLEPHLYDQLRIYWSTPVFLAKSEVAKKARRRNPLPRFNAT